MTVVVPGADAFGSLADLRSRLQQRGYGTDTKFAQNALINSVYRRIWGMRRWWFLEVAFDTSLVTTANTESVALSAVEDLLHVDRVLLSYGSETYPLKYVRQSEFNALKPELTPITPGTPTVWTRVAGSLYFYPTPDKAYTVLLDYVKEPPPLVSDSDVSVLPPAYEDLLVWGPIRELTFRERDDNGWALANTEYNERLGDMVRQDGLEQRQTSQEVVRSDDGEF